MLDVALLGTGGMMPLPNRFLTSMLCRFNGRLLMIDCGEGTQVTLKLLGWGFKNIDTICFTHFHADHISGLPGILLTIGNSGRTEPITLIGPKGLKKVVDGLRVIAPELQFEINFEELENESCLKFNDFLIKSIQVDHGLPCFAYSINIERNGLFDLEKAEKLGLPKKYWSILQRNEYVEYDGKVYTSDMVLGEPRKGFKISYCTDSRPTESLPEFVKDSDLFICEGIYGEDEKLSKAIEHKHMIFSEAATIAKKGNVRELWLTHYSPALIDPQSLIHFAKDIFENSHCGHDRKTTSFKFNSDL